MTVPTSAVRGALWPTLDQMTQYLQNWVTYATELESRVTLLEEALQAREQVLTERINSLHAELGATEKPLLEKISNLEAAIPTAKAEILSLRNELDAATRLLATALEVTGPRLSLQSLINEAVILISEAKDQLRESL